MTHHNLVEVSRSRSTNLKKERLYLLPKITKKTEQFAVQFSFIDIGQWLLLVFLNFVCLGFIIFSRNLIY